MSMRVKKGVLAVFFAFCFLSINLAFYDDFQIYNSVTNPYFTSNYSVNSTIAGGELVVSIGSAYNVFLQFHNDFAAYDDLSGISLNYSKISASSDFDFNISILSGTFVYDATGFLSIGYFVNNTDSASKDFKSLRGYRVIFTYYDGGNISATLCRNTIDMMGCGVTLAYGSVILENYYGTGTTTLTVNNTIPIELYYNPATNLLTVYAGNHTLFTHTDTVYTSGGFVITSSSLSSRVTDLMLDNLSIYGISGVIPSGTGWSLYSFPQNIPNYLDYGQYRFVHRIFQAAPNYCLLGSNVCFSEDSLGFDIITKPFTTETTNTTYLPTCLKGYTDTNFCTIIPIQYLSSIALGIKYDEGTYYLKYGNSFLNEDLRRLLGIQAYNKIQASNSGCYYYNSLYTALNNQPISINSSIYWGSSSVWGGYPTTQIDIYGGFGFYCSSPNNITITTEIYQNGTLIDTLNTILPVGCLRDSNGTVDCGSIVDCTANASLCAILILNQPIGELTCIVGDTRPECISQQQEPSLDTIVNALFSYTMIGLYLSIIIASIVAYYTRNAMFGAIIMMVCLMIMSSVGLLNAWFMFLTIAIIALGVSGMLVLKK